MTAGDRDALPGQPTDDLARLRAATAAGRISAARVSGESMVPTLFPGDVVLLEACPEPRAGEIVAFERDGSLVVHRVRRVDGGVVVCRGDNHHHDDRPVARDVLVGRATEVVGRPGAVRVRSHRSIVLRRRLFHARRRVRQWAAELALLAGQVAHPREVRQGPLSAAGALSLPSGERGVTVAPDRDGDVSIPAGEPGTPLLVPIGVYGRLARPQRVALGGRLAGRRAVVYAWPRQRARRLTRLLWLVRRALLRCGVRCGAVGDGALSRGGWLPPGFIHYFSATELEAELREAGHGDVRVEMRRLGSGDSRLVLAAVLGERDGGAR